VGRALGSAALGVSAANARVGAEEIAPNTVLGGGGGGCDRATQLPG
jgi:hypothetical protein